MKNPIFKAQVADLFEKVSWPYVPGDVANQVPSDLGGEIERGRAIGRAGKHVVEKAPDVARALGRAGRSILKPAGPTVADPFYKFLGGVKDVAKAHPGLVRGAVGLSLLAPILGASASGAQHQYEDQLMNLREDPDRDVTASLDEFLEKKAAGPGGYMSFPQMGGSAQGAFAAGIGGGIGTGIIDALGGAISGGAGALRDMFVTDKRRNTIFSTLLQQDVVLHDAVQRNPLNLDVLKEAYATMSRFAPSLAVDVNAVRSFLREAVIGGGGVNYASIKNLVETEKALHVRSK